MIKQVVILLVLVIIGGSQGNECKSPYGSFRDVDTGNCICPAFSRNVGDECKCTEGYTSIPMGCRNNQCTSVRAAPLDQQFSSYSYYQALGFNRSTAFRQNLISGYGDNSTEFYQVLYLMDKIMITYPNCVKRENLLTYTNCNDTTYNNYMSNRNRVYTLVLFWRCSQPICDGEYTIYANNYCDCLPTFVWNLQGKCVCLNNKIPIRNVCGCPPNSNADYWGNCKCNAGFEFTSYGTCECPANQTAISGRCECKPTFIKVGYNCVCPERSTIQGDSCSCRDGFVYNATTKSCVCPSLEYLMGEACECVRPFIRDSRTKQCVCPQNTVLWNDNCKCVSGFLDDGNGVCRTCPQNQTSIDGKTCVCNATYVKQGDSCVCPRNASPDPATGLCVCNEGFYNSNGTCLCQDGKVLNAEGVCSCPANTTQLFNSCECKVSFVYNPECGHCVCPPKAEYDMEDEYCFCKNNRINEPLAGACCRKNELYIDGECQCAPGFVDCPGSDGCKCPENEHLSQGTCICDAGYVRDTSTGRCCGVNEFDDFGECNCKPGFTRNPSTKRCTCPENEVLITTNGTCVCKFGFVRDTYSDRCCLPHQRYLNGCCQCEYPYEFNEEHQQCVVTK